MLKDLNITRKFPLVMIFFALVSVVVTGVIAFIHTKDNMILSAQDKLISLLESRKSSLQQYIDTIENDVQFHAQSPLVLDALQLFSDAWLELPDEKEQYLQNNYVYQNPFAVGNKGSLLDARDGSEYSRVHSEFHPVFSNMIEARSFYDLFLFDPQGNLLYSVKKESDFATNFITGQWQSSHLAQIFNTINAKPQTAVMYHADFLPYPPSLDKPASFIGIPVFNSEHKYLGVLAFQLPIEPVNDVMQVTAGMGASGETYLVGRDFLMRSNSRFLEGEDILQTRVQTYSAEQGLTGNSGIGVLNDYRNIPVFSAYTAVDFLGTRWAMIAEVDEAEVLLPLYTMNNFILISGILIAIAILFLGYLLATDIARPIVTMTRIMHKLSNNDLNVNIRVDERKDEVGEMANAMTVFKNNALKQDALKKELTYVIEHDILTGLSTRKYALEQLSRLIETAEKTGKKLVLMFIDLDNFKLINDSYGHQVGDRVLCEVAQKIKKSIREGDVVARIGGDEFIIIMPNIIEKDDSIQIANKIIEGVHRFSQGPSKVPGLTLSIGLSVYPDDATNSSSLLKKADGAMYSVKSTGKGSYNYWNDTMEE